MLLPTTIAGSLPKPAWLAEPQKLWAAWRHSGAELRQAQRDATLVVLHEQAQAGIDIVSNGEQFRQHFVHGFLTGIEGVDFNRRQRIGIRDNRYEADCPTIVGPISRPAPVHGEEVAFTRANTDRKLKFTLPGPMTIVDTLVDEHYGDRVTLAMAFARLINAEARELEALGVDVIQLDEPAFNVYLDAVEDWGIDALHEAIDGLRCKTAVHICYGYGIEENLSWKRTLGESWQQYERTFPLLALSRIDQVSLECAGSRVPLPVLELLRGKDVMVGVIDVATTHIETPVEVADTIRSALQYVDADKLVPCTNCGMVPLAREVALGKLQALGAGAALVRSQLSG